jgi:hypothetical protein
MAEGFSIPASAVEHEWRAAAHESAFQYVGIHYWRCNGNARIFMRLQKAVAKSDY